jgi:hypothetical protein
MDIENIYKRMQKAGGGVDCGIDFLPDNMVKLWWDVSLFSRIEITLSRYHMTVESREFQNKMMTVELKVRAMK